MSNKKQQSDFVGFIWYVRQDGYFWVDRKEELYNGEVFTNRYLTDGRKLATVNNGPSSSGEVYEPNAKHLRETFENFSNILARYQPLKLYPKLYKEFGNLGLDQHNAKVGEKNILAFANEYGNLGEGVEENISLMYSETEGILSSGESYSKWCDQITKMHHAIKLWELIRDNDTKSLADLLFWTPDGGIKYYSLPRGWEYPLEEIDRLNLPYNYWTRWIRHKLDQNTNQVAWKIKRNDNRIAGLFFLKDLISENLKGKVSPRILWNSKKKELQMLLFPSSLIGALWFQFAQVVVRQKSLKTCVVCGKIIVGEEMLDARRDKLYCSKACKSKAYRERKKLAS